MTRLNYEVEINQKGAKEVAMDYLTKKGLLTDHD
jgi:glycine betaine/choline ABC-type transport system substrate-binding protein